MIAQAPSQEVLQLPGFHMRKVPVKNSRMYRLDTHVSEGGIATAYGLHGVEIYDAGFDYSVITQEPGSNTHAAWLYPESPWQTTFVVKGVDENTGGYKLVVKSMLGKQVETCIQNHAEVDSSSYFYKTINMPRYWVKSYSVGLGCD